MAKKKRNVGRRSVARADRSWVRECGQALTGMRAAMSRIDAMLTQEGELIGNVPAWHRARVHTNLEKLVSEAMVLMSSNRQARAQAVNTRK